MKKYLWALLFVLIFQACSCQAATYTPEQLKYQKEIKSTASFSPRAFHDAIIRNDYAAVEKFLKAGINPNAQLLDTCALAGAILTENNEILTLLLDNGSDPNMVFAQWTPLNYALWKNNSGAAKILIEKGANISTKSAGGYPLDVAVQKENADLVGILYSKKAQFSPYVVYNALQSNNEEIKSIFTQDHKVEDLEFVKIKETSDTQEEKTKIQTRQVI